MRVLVVGGGAREHALCWKLAQSPVVSKLFCSPGNPGTGLVAQNLPYKVNDIDGIVAATRDLGIEFVVVGPEEPLSLGLADRLRSAGITVFGPSQAAARIETSKQWAKEIMAQAGVPTARSTSNDDLSEALAAIDQYQLPVVVKADGLAAGKGVVIAETRDEAERALRSFMSDRSLGAAGARCLVEEFLEGTELSVFALCDGATSRLFLSACDYKRLGTGDVGPNTGGMGSYAPPPFATPALLEAVMQTIIEPTASAMYAAGAPMQGVFFAGLMLTSSGPKVLEFNVRFGDPETQVMLPLLEDDLLDLLYRTATGDLASIERIRVRDGAAVGVVLASGGYPGNYATGKPISGLDEQFPDTQVFQAGTRAGEGPEIVTAGGRVLTVVGTGQDLAAARALAYRRLEGIAFEEMTWRSDIAAREIQRVAP